MNPSRAMRLSGSPTQEIAGRTVGRKGVSRYKGRVCDGEGALCVSRW